MQKISPCLWFDTQGEEAANLYISLFPNSRIVETTYHGEAGPGRAGTVLTVEFELDGERFLALNGGPQYNFSEAVSFQVYCDDQAEVDYYWNNLSAGGEEGPCGWLKDKFGLSWQIVPRKLPEFLADPDREKAERAMNAMMSMGKLDIAALQRAFDGAA